MLLAATGILSRVRSSADGSTIIDDPSGRRGPPARMEPDAPGAHPRRRHRLARVSLRSVAVAGSVLRRRAGASDDLVAADVHGRRSAIVSAARAASRDFAGLLRNSLWM